ncbi:MAG: YihY/virulence factor BrkB family protein [Bacteroidota bacterium]
MKRKLIFKNTLFLVRESYREFMNDKVMKLSAALAYYTVFSLPPLLLVTIGLLGLFYGRDAIEGEIFMRLQEYIGGEAALQIQEVLKKSSAHHDNTVATIVGLFTLLLGATGIFGEVQDSINFIWGLKARPRKGWVKLIINRLLSFSMILILGFVLLVSLLLNAALEVFLGQLKTLFSERIVDSLYIINYAVSIVVIATLFACIFKVLPDAKIRWKDVWVGALVTTLLFMIGKTGISYYLQNNTTITAYGAAGSLIVILLWVYYSAIILYFGAEFTQAYIRFRGRRIEPNKYAVWVERRIVEKESNISLRKTG